VNGVWVPEVHSLMRATTDEKLSTGGATGDVKEVRISDSVHAWRRIDLHQVEPDLRQAR
jgi:hypothetical protein